MTRLLPHARQALIALAALVAVAGCGATQSESRMSLLLTDASGDFKAAVVTIDRIYLQGAGGKVVLRDEKVTTNLLSLANDTATLVDEKVVPAGTYGELRFVLSGGYVEVDNGDGTSSIYASSPSYEGLPQGAQVAGDLQMPSLASSGLKVKLPGDKLVIEGEQKIVLVDFDVAQSFGHAAGNGRKWVMHPELKAEDLQATGSVRVVLLRADGVTLPTDDQGHPLTLGQLGAVLENSAGSREPLLFTDDDGDGVFEAPFKFLLPGDYLLDVVGPAGVQLTTSPAHPVAVTLGSGKAVTQAFTLKAAERTGQ